MEIVTTTAALAIGKIALDKFVEGGAGELGKKLTTAATDKLIALGNKVLSKIRGNETAMEVLIGAAEEKPEDIQKLTNYLGSLWTKQPEFAAEVKKLADALHFELTQIENNSPIVQNIGNGGVGYAVQNIGSHNKNFTGGTHNHPS
jgi:hypothetical protein